MALGLDALIKSFGSPNLGLVQTGRDGIGINPVLVDALMADPRLALEARRLGLREPVPLVVDCPESRLIIDRIAANDDAMQQTAAILSGAPYSLAIDSLLLLHLLPFTPCLPVGGIAALTEPHDAQRRFEVVRHIGGAVASGSLPSGCIDGLAVIDHRDYLDWPGRLPGSKFLYAWLGTLESRTQPHFMES
jgi:hypothetical protein